MFKKTFTDLIPVFSLWSLSILERFLNKYPVFFTRAVQVILRGWFEPDVSDCYPGTVHQLLAGYLTIKSVPIHSSDFWSFPYGEWSQAFIVPNCENAIISA